MTFGTNKLWLIALLGGAALLLAIAGPLLFRSGDRVPAPAAQTVQPWPITAKGVVESEDELEIASQVKGQIDEVLVDEGDLVKAGDLLIRFDSSKMTALAAQAQAALREARARHLELANGYRREQVDEARHALSRATASSDEARRHFERQERLLSQSATTRVERDRAEEAYLVALASQNEANARYEQMKQGPRAEQLAAVAAAEDRARAEYDYYQALLGDYQIASPIDGVIVQRFRNSKETVDLGTPILTMVNPQNLRVWAELEESDAGKIVVGQQVVVTVDAHPGKEYKGRVTKIDAAVKRKAQKSFDPVASFDVNTQKIMIALDEYKGLLHGMSATVRFLR